MFLKNRLIVPACKGLLALQIFLVAVSTASVWAADVQQDRVEAARLNNRGVALMNQQLTEKALGQFVEAHAADPSMVALQINRGIALLYMQKLPEADAVLIEAARLDPKNPSIWYSLGLVHRSAGKPELAISDFQYVVALDPSDADTHYFLGSSYFEVQQFDKAQEEFQAALRLNPVHASAVFGLARTLQRLGKSDEAREQLKRFSHLTHDKVSSPLTTVYGEQGHYATVQDVLLPEPPVGAMIPVQFEPQPVHGAAAMHAVQGDGLGGGACILDITGAGHKDLIVLGSGEHAIHAYRNLGNGSLEEIAEQQTGLRANGEAIACAVGDYDNDKLPDLAVAFSDRVILFHNLGDGKFADVTKAVGIQPLNRPAGLTFVDFDHDGDLDLICDWNDRQWHGAECALAEQWELHLYRMDGTDWAWRVQMLRQR